MRSISVVVPAYNEEALIEQCVREISHVLLEMGGEHEIVIVDDGSTDKTTAVALDVASVVPHVRVLRLLRNMGKGAALVFGAGQSSCELIAFVDADLEVHPRQLALLCASLVSAPAEVAIGSKHHPGAHVSLDRGRRFLSLLYAKVVQALFDLPVHDTQTGFKIFEAGPLQQALAEGRVNRYAFDLELLVGLARRGWRITEVPVTVTSVRLARRITFADVVTMALDTMHIWRRHRRLSLLAPTPAKLLSDRSSNAGTRSGD